MALGVLFVMNEDDSPLRLGEDFLASSIAAKEGGDFPSKTPSFWGGVLWENGKIQIQSAS